MLYEWAWKKFCQQYLEFREIKRKKLGDIYVTNNFKIHALLIIFLRFDLHSYV